MDRQLQDIFEECIERLRQGDSVENCLMSYPEVAADLEILLRTALNVNWRASMVRPRPEFKASARAQFIWAQHYAAQAEEVKPPPTFFSLQRAWMPALAVVLIVALSSVGTAAAASNAMPDEPLYPVKIATEQVQLTLAFSDEAKVEVNTKLAETRSQEIAAMATEGKTEQVVIATERLAQNIEAAEVAIQRVEKTEIPAPTTSHATTTAPPQPAPPPQSEPTPVPTTEPTTPPTPEPTPAPTTEPTTPPTPEPAPAPTTEPSTSATSGNNTRAAGSQPSPAPDKVKAAEAAKLRQSLKATISKNLTVMENAQSKAPEKTKQVLQQAIDMAKNRQIKLQQQRSTETQPKPPADPRTYHQVPAPIKNWKPKPPGTEGKNIPPPVTPSTSNTTSPTTNNTTGTKNK